MEDTKAFRNALGEFATGVAVITAESSTGDPIGMTMSSFNSVSLNPPLVLFSVDRRAHSLDAMQKAKHFAVNILGREQEEISNRFARALSDKWLNVKLTAGYSQAPLITGALAHFECKPYAQYDGGDHIIFVVQVTRFSVRPGDPAPLVFFRGRYCDIADDSNREPTWPLPIHY